MHPRVKYSTIINIKAPWSTGQIPVYQFLLHGKRLLLHWPSGIHCSLLQGCGGSDRHRERTDFGKVERW